MKFYHGTSEENWKQIQKDGQLFGYSRVTSNDGKKILREFRVTYLATKIEDARLYGDVILEVEYTPNKKDNNYYDEDCWQIRVYVPIFINNIKRIE